jgi:hypothetical protein
VIEKWSDEEKKQRMEELNEKGEISIIVENGQEFKIGKEFI